MKINLNGENLKIALQRKGRLSGESLALLKATGVEFDFAEGRLFARSRNFPLDILFLRDDDIPEYVQDGVVDLGIVGLNVVKEKNARVSHLDLLGFGTCELAIAVPKSSAYRTVFALSGRRIATSYPNILSRYIEEKGLQDIRVIEITGSVEITPSLDVADAIFDLVSTGSTLRLHELESLEVVMKSEAVLIADPKSLDDPAKGSLIHRLRARVLSHLRARRTKYVMMNAPEGALDRIKEILPGMKSPTILPLAEKGMIAVHTAVPEELFWDVAERLKETGATDILVVPVEKMVM